MAERHEGGYRQEEGRHERQGQRRFGEEESRGRWRATDDERDWGYRTEGIERGRGERRGWSAQGAGESFEHSPRGYGSERYGERSYGRESYGRGYEEGYGGGREGYGRGEYGQRRYGAAPYGGEPYGGSRNAPSPHEGFGGYEGWNERGLGAWQHGPGGYGERSYGGYGEWPGPEREGLESGREGYGGVGPEFLEGRRRAGSSEWGLGHAGARGGWRERLRGGFGMQAGRFTGRGPQGYQRSDERIREDVCDALMADPEIDASFMTVTVDACEVTLEGSVEDRQMKRDAEDLVEQIPGVKQVHNRLRVQPGGADEAQRGAQAGASVSGTASAGIAQQKRSS
ncbi:MAG TPA: BON domain-containing protein [Candidatus Binatia bacterium]